MLRSGVSAWSACDREGRRRFVAMKAIEATLVTIVKQCAMMRGMQNEEFQQLHQVIEDMNEWQEKLVSTMERQQKLMGKVLELRRAICHEIKVLDDRISVEEVALLEKKQAMKKLLKERRGEPKWRNGETQLLLRVGLLRRPQLGLKTPMRIVTPSCPRWEFR